jgi:two-component system sensor histidine kinase VicK
MVNHATCDILGWKEQELIGKFIIDAIPMQNETGETLAPSERPMTKVLSLKRSIVTSPTNYYVKKDKTKVPVRFTLTPLIFNDEVVGTIEVFSDTTKEKEIDRAKSEFVFLASHQLRTPLTTIKWYVEELLKQDHLDDTTQKKYLSEVSLASHRMAALIDALLHASQIELGRFFSKPQQISLIKIADQTIQDLHSYREKKQNIIQKYYQKDIPTFFADPKFVTIILQNLLSNAIKYSKDKGSIELHISYDKKGYLIRVIDHGYGIPENQTVKIFSKMFRADNALRIDPEGTGLGLYIVKSIVEASGGKIWFTSEENKGTTFSVSFPPSGMQQKEGQKLLG